MQRLFFTVFVRVFDGNRFKPFDRGVLFGNRQAAFVMRDGFFAVRRDDGIDHFIGLFRFVVARNVNNNHAFQQPDLRRGQSDARRGVHRFQHIVQHFAQIVGQRFDFFAFLFQKGIGNFQNFQ